MLILRRLLINNSAIRTNGIIYNLYQYYKTPCYDIQLPAEFYQSHRRTGYLFVSFIAAEQLCGGLEPQEPLVFQIIICWL